MAELASSRRVCCAGTCGGDGLSGLQDRPVDLGLEGRLGLSGGVVPLEPDAWGAGETERVETFLSVTPLLMDGELTGWFHFSQPGHSVSTQISFTTMMCVRSSVHLNSSSGAQQKFALIKKKKIIRQNKARKQKVGSAVEGLASASPLIVVRPASALLRSAE